MWRSFFSRKSFNSSRLLLIRTGVAKGLKLYQTRLWTLVDILKVNSKLWHSWSRLSTSSEAWVKEIFARNWARRRMPRKDPKNFRGSKKSIKRTTCKIFAQFLHPKKWASSSCGTISCKDLWISEDPLSKDAMPPSSLPPNYQSFWKWILVVGRRRRTAAIDAFSSLFLGLVVGRRSITSDSQMIQGSNDDAGFSQLQQYTICFGQTAKNVQFAARIVWLFFTF